MMGIDGKGKKKKPCDAVFLYGTVDAQRPGFTTEARSSQRRALNSCIPNNLWLGVLRVSVV